MERFKLILLWMLLVPMGMLSCGPDDASPDSPGEACFTGEIVKSVKKQNDRVYYNADEKRYAVYVAIPGTIDSRDAGFICEGLDTLKVDGLSISFDGNYFSYDKDSRPPMGGLQYYNLDISRFEINKQ